MVCSGVFSVLNICDLIKKTYESYLVKFNFRNSRNVQISSSFIFISFAVIVQMA